MTTLLIFEVRIISSSWNVGNIKIKAYIQNTHHIARQMVVYRIIWINKQVFQGWGSLVLGTVADTEAAVEL